MSNIEKLNSIKKILKSEFIGIDKQINQIINLITPWYIDPDLLDKPIIINLWGMTGSGKTSIVRRISELLDCSDKFYEIDLGKFTGQDSSSFNSLFDPAKKLSSKRAIFLIDEIQMARTVDKIEIDRPILRDLWSFLNDGKVIYPAYNDLITDYIFSSFLDKEDDELRYDKLDDYIIREIFKNFRVDLRSTEIKNELKDLYGKNFIKGLLSIVNKFATQRTDDFSKSLVFVAGNLDEAFLESKNMDHDLIPIDELFESTSKVNTTTIKNTLLTRFRPEQVSRLGYNHIIFPSLNKNNYNKILDKYISKTKEKIKLKSKTKIEFSESLKLFLIEEGVVSTQGVRAFESTFLSLINSKVPHIIIYSNKYKVDNVLLEYDEQNHNFLINFFKKTKKVYSIKEDLSFEINKKRNSLHPEPLRSYVAYHEAGHAVVGYLVFNSLPLVVRSKLSDSDIGGVVRFKNHKVLTKKDILNEITCLYGGMAAEKLIFGEENISIYSQEDLQQATKEASDAVRLYGMGKFLGVTENDSSHPENLLSTFYTEEDDSTIEKILQECFNKAEDLLIMNSDFHKEVAELLRKKTYLTTEEFKKIAIKYEGEKK